jgi:hypothetical protein
MTRFRLYKALPYSSCRFRLTSGTSEKLQAVADFDPLGGAEGNLYGVTDFEGDLSSPLPPCGGFGCGVVYKLSPPHDFAAESPTGESIAANADAWNRNLD